MLLKLKLVQIHRPRLCVSWDPAQILLVNEVINYGAVPSLSLSRAGVGGTLPFQWALGWEAASLCLPA